MIIGKISNTSLFFNGKKDKKRHAKGVPHGADYSSVPVEFTRTEYSSKQILDAATEGKLPQLRKQMITERIPMTLRVADNMCKLYPQLSKDDVAQDLLLLTTEKAIEFDGQNGTFSQVMAEAETKYFAQKLKLNA